MKIYVKLLSLCNILCNSCCIIIVVLFCLHCRSVGNCCTLLNNVAPRLKRIKIVAPSNDSAIVWVGLYRIGEILDVFALNIKNSPYLQNPLFS